MMIFPTIMFIIIHSNSHLKCHGVHRAPSSVRLENNSKHHYVPPSVHVTLIADESATPEKPDKSVLSQILWNEAKQVIAPHSGEQSQKDFERLAKGLTSVTQTTPNLWMFDRSRMITHDEMRRPQSPILPVQKRIKISINSGKISGHFEHNWRSTGLCPPDPHMDARSFLLSQDEKLNLALIGSLPHDGVVQVRIHWLLDLVIARIERNEPRYNFTYLDDLMDHLREHDLRPGFELMGNPGNIFSDLENATQVQWWRILVAQTARRYVDKYGLEWVSSWNWESWNEPDHHDFDNLNFTLQGFLNYFDACRRGLDDVSQLLVFGGPGGSCRDPDFSKLCWALLEHCNNGSSYFTPGVPPKIDFISFHKKGKEDADSILEQEIQTISNIHSRYPLLRHVPIINDEGDFQKGWWRGLEWRADARYAALVARSVYLHQMAKAKIPYLHYKLMSFDNAFLNYRPSFFNQRTMMARFQINSTRPRQVQFVKKPAYTVMSLLSLLGDKTLVHTSNSVDDRISVLSTCRHCHSDRIFSLTSAKDETSEDLLLSRSEIQSPRLDRNRIKENGISPYRLGLELGRSSGRRIKRRTKVKIRNIGSIFSLGSFDSQGRTAQHNTISYENAVELNNSLSQSLQEHEISPEWMSRSMEFSKLKNTNRHNHVSQSTYISVTQKEAGVYNSFKKPVYENKHEDSTSAIDRTTLTAPERATLSGASSTIESWEATLLLSLSNGTLKNHEEVIQVKVSFAIPRFLVGKNLFVAEYRLGGTRKGPYEAWLDLENPIEPNRTQLAYIRSFEGAYRRGPTMFQDVHPVLGFKANLTMPEVVVIHICNPTRYRPGQVVNVNTIGVSRADVLITWSDARIGTRCVLHYEVQRSRGGRGGPYWTISNGKNIDNNFMYSLPHLTGNETVAGWYRVRVVTYWGATGAFSTPVYHFS